MSRILLNIIIVTYNSQEHIGKCLENLFIDLDTDHISAVITVIDNYSSDKTIKILNKYKNRIKIVKNNENLGFAKAVNIGIKLIKSKNYLLLNPDAYIEIGSVTKLINCSKKYLGIIGGKTVGLGGESQGDHFRKPNLWVGIFDFTNLKRIDPFNYWHRYFYFKDEAKNLNCREVDCVTGGFMMINNNVIDKIGLFDENYFMYLEDVDYCVRAKNNDLKVIYCPKALVKHVGGGSSKNKERSNLNAWFDSRKKYFKKNFSYLENLVIQPLFWFDKYFIKIKKINENYNN